MPERFGRVVTPVYAPSSDGLLEPVGSAVLIRDGAGYWVFSAAHVFDRARYRELWLPGAPDFFLLTETIYRSRDGEVVDLAYTRLTQEEADKLVAGGHAFLPARRNTIDHADVTPGEGACMVVGYPWMRVQPVEGNRQAFSVQAMEYRGQLASLERIQRYGRDPSVTLMVLFDAKLWSEGEAIKRPPKEGVEGVSGGAIWGCYSDNVRLLGIVHSFVESRSLLLGTRCRVFPMIAKGDA
ncbi:MAG: hypothetical protein JNG83_07045 [Opitutaceae bacterium]|nr:hypothetical protein [Opitutaceae bacterium]